MYFSLTTSQLPRNLDALAVIQFSDLQPSDPLYWGLNVVAAIIYGCVFLSIFICVIILVLQFLGHDLQWDFESGQEKS